MGKEKNTLAVGLDVGTMNLVASRSDSDDVKITRNVFLCLERKFPDRWSRV